MNNYPVWWEDTITVYNKFVDDNKQITWHKTVLADCFWKYQSSNFISRQSVMQYHALYLDTNKVTCRVPKNPYFLPKEEWKANTGRSNYFTFAPGDIVVKGECSEGIDEYTSGSRSSDFVKAKKEAGEAFTIESVSINTGSGKCCEHYFIVGE